MQDISFDLRYFIVAALPPKEVERDTFSETFPVFVAAKVSERGETYTETFTALFRCESLRE